MNSKRLPFIIAALALAITVLPLAAAQTGGGQTDVRHEPSAPNLDAAESPPRATDVAVGSGFPLNPSAGNTGPGGDFSPQDWTQILEGYYGANKYPLQQLEVNNVQRHLLEEVAGVETVHERYILPGRTDWSVWWGWWKDVPGQDDSLEDQTPGGDGTDGDSGRIYDINDYKPGQGSADVSPACDTHGSTPTNALCGEHKDEFVWRGDSTYMINQGDGTQKACYKDGICDTFPADAVRLFVQPGTTEIGSGPAGTFLADGQDHGARSDTALVDDTDTDDSQGYFNEGNNWGWNFHRSMLVTTRVVTSVNPQPTLEGKYEPWDHPVGTDGVVTEEDGASDTDFYSSVHPAVEDAYRFAVWDPHDNYDCSGPTYNPTQERQYCDQSTADPNNRASHSPFPTNPVPGFHLDDGEPARGDQQNDRGAYEAARFVWNDIVSNAGDIAVETEQSAEEPVASTMGFAGLNSGGWVDIELHEPNVGTFTGPAGQTHTGDVYPGATFQSTNADAVYLADTDESTPFYYDSTTCDQAGPDCEVPDGWDGYENNDMVWADADGEWQQPCWCFIYYTNTPFVPAGMNVPNTGASPNNEERQQTMAPGVLKVSGFVGLWHDKNDDDFIGKLSEFGRYTEEGDPYQEGTVDDPNDYGDTASATASDPAKSGFAEFTGLATDATQTTITIVPLTEPEDHDNDPATPKQRPWGELGVYLMHDSDTTRGANFIPYDDVIGDSVPEPLYWGDTGPLEQANSALDCQLSCEDPGWQFNLDDDDDKQGSRHRTHGPIQMNYKPSEFKNAGTKSVFHGKKDVIFPTGAFDYPVKIITEVGFPSDKTVKARKGGTIGNSQMDVTGQQLTDVDILAPADGSWTAR